MTAKKLDRLKKLMNEPSKLELVPSGPEFVIGGQVKLEGVVIKLGEKRVYLTIAAAQQLKQELFHI